MSIKGTTKELYIGKTGVNLITFMGNKVSLTYEQMKRIDYCYATSKKGYMNFVTQANIIENFNFSNNANELIQKTVDFIHEYAPNLEMIEYYLDDEKKNRSIKIQAIFGYKELGLKSGYIIITQEPSGKIFLNKDKSTFYATGMRMIINPKKHKNNSAIPHYPLSLNSLFIQRNTSSRRSRM